MTVATWSCVGHGFNCAKYLLVVDVHLIWSLEASLRLHEAKGEHVIGADSQIHASQVPEAVNGEASSGEQGEGQC